MTRPDSFLIYFYFTFPFLDSAVPAISSHVHVTVIVSRVLFVLVWLGPLLKDLFSRLLLVFNFDLVNPPAT